MWTKSNDSTTYIGQNAGEELRNNIHRARNSLKIVSPYLTASYVDDLIKIAKKGVEVTLITANDVEQGDGKFSDFQHTDLIDQVRKTNEEKKEKRERGMRYSGIAFIIPILAFLLGYYIVGGSLLLIVGLIFYYFKDIRIYSYSYNSPIRLRVIKDNYKGHGGTHLVHAKIFVIDERVAYVGSVNYTHPAFNKNYEVITRIQDESSIRKISKEVDDLFNDNKLVDKDLKRELLDKINKKK